MDLTYVACVFELITSSAFSPNRCFGKLDSTIIIDPEYVIQTLSTNHPLRCQKSRNTWLWVASQTTNDSALDPYKSQLDDGYVVRCKEVQKGLSGTLVIVIDLSPFLFVKPADSRNRYQCRLSPSSAVFISSEKAFVMPELSQEATGHLSAGPTKQTYSASHRPPITPRNSIETSHHPLESYPFGPEQISGHDTNLELPQDKPAAVDLLVRLLVDILVYSYDVDFHELHYALAACSPKLSTTNLSARNISLLTYQGTRVALEYADVIHKACETVVDNTQSLLKDSDREFISTFIMEPARTIGVDIAYVFEQLYAFRVHRCEGGNHHKTLLYTKPSFWTRGRGLLPGKLGMDKSQKLLARRLVSDDMVVAQLGTRSCEALRLVLGKAIKDYNGKHCKYGMAKINREVYAEPKFIALKKELKWRDFVFTKHLHDEQQAAMASGQSNFRDSNQAEPRTSSRFLDVPRRNSEHLRRPSSLHDLPSIRERPERPPRPLSTSNIRLGSLRSRPARPGLWTNY